MHASSLAHRSFIPYCLHGLRVAASDKPFVVQHKTALEDLCAGLLVDKGNPRRGQEGDAKLQETCALVLQNLALSEVGKIPLQRHSDVLRSLRVLASEEGGLLAEARQYASGALFELDEVGDEATSKGGGRKSKRDSGRDILWQR